MKHLILKKKKKLLFRNKPNKKRKKLLILLKYLNSLHNTHIYIMYFHAISELNLANLKERKIHFSINFIFLISGYATCALTL